MFRSLRLASGFAAAVSALALAGAAQAGITVVNGAFIIPTHANDFEDIGPHAGYSPTPPYNGAYTQGGITVQHIGGDKIVTTYQHDGQFSWYDGSGDGGYTKITLADSSPMNAFQFDATTQLIQPIGAGIPFYYELLLGGNVVATGSGGALCDTIVVCFGTYGFKGGNFDEIRLQANIFLTGFDGSTPHPDVLLLDNLFAHAVPEPASWAMMLAGLGIVGSAMRRQRKQAIVSFA